MIEAPHYSAAGASKKAVALPEALFDGTVNQDVLHRAVITFLSNQRHGTSNTLTRSEVSGGNQKPWRQKGTGRARQGSTRAPHWRHGARAAPAQLPARHPEENAPAGQEIGAQRARAGRRARDCRCARVREAEDEGLRGVAEEAR